MPTRKEDGDRETPVFLAKTYRMVDEGSPDIVGWTADGRSFVIKDCDRFTEEVIPKYFKHKNFSSFVRQLNFYGFRKVKDGRPRGASKEKQKPKWEFHHPSFRQGEKELLKDIKRRSYQDAAHAGPNKGDVEKLRDELASLQRQMADLSGYMQSLVSTVKTLQEEVESVDGKSQATDQHALGPELESTVASDRQDWLQDLQNQNFEAVEGELNAFYEATSTLDMPKLSRISSLEASFEGLPGGTPPAPTQETDLPADGQRTMGYDAGGSRRGLTGVFGPLGGISATQTQTESFTDGFGPALSPPTPSRERRLSKGSSATRSIDGPVARRNKAVLSARAKQEDASSEGDLYARLQSLTQEEQNLLIDRMARLILQNSGLDDQERKLKAAQAASFASGAQAPHVEESIGLSFPCSFHRATRDAGEDDAMRRKPVEVSRILPISAGAMDEEL